MLRRALLRLALSTKVRRLPQVRFLKPRFFTSNLMRNHDDRSSSAILFATEYFKVSVVRDNQKVPGILEVRQLNHDLDQFRKLTMAHLRRLNEIQRVCEKLLIKTFYSQEGNLSKEEERSILINSYFREINESNGHRRFLSLRFYPRYPAGQAVLVPQNPAFPIILSDSNKEIPEGYARYTDPAPGKPFLYAATKSDIPSYPLYKTIVSHLRRNLSACHATVIEQDIFYRQHDKCFFCKHPSKHIDKAGVMELTMNGKSLCKITLDARDQSHPGRGYVVLSDHVNAVRYTSDNDMALLYKIADAYQRAAEKIFNNSDSERAYHRAILMNLSEKEKGGPHVHIHILPRNDDLEYPMISKNYRAMISDPIQKEKLVAAFSEALKKEIESDPILQQAGICFNYLAHQAIHVPETDRLKSTINGLRMFTTKKSLATIHVIRHVQTNFNEMQRIQGCSSIHKIEPTERGMKEAETKLSKLEKPTLLITSNLLRTQQTAELLFGLPYERINIPKMKLEGLNEIHAGALEGLYMNQLPAEYKPIWDSWKRQPHSFCGFPQGETMQEFQVRVLTAFSEITKKYGNNKESRIAIFAHGGSMRVLRCFLSDKDISHFWERDIGNAEHWELSETQIQKLQNFDVRSLFLSKEIIKSSL